MRNPQKPNPNAITRREPVPRFGATLDVFESIDAGEFGAVSARLDERVTGRVCFPDGSVVAFASRTEFLDQVVPAVRSIQRAGVRLSTQITNYSVDVSEVGVISSIDLQRHWHAEGSVPVVHRGHATLVWNGASGTWLIVQWLVTWELGRIQSGDFSKLGGGQ